MNYTIISETDFQKARKKIREAKSSKREVVFTSSNDDLNRKILEKENIDILLINLSGRKDKLKQRDSGFNHVLAKIAKKKGIKIGIDLDSFSGLSSKDKTLLLGRIRQNVKICRKLKLHMVFISKHKKDLRNLKSLGLVLGMPTWMTKALK